MVLKLYNYYISLTKVVIILLKINIFTTISNNYVIANYIVIRQIISILTVIIQIMNLHVITKIHYYYLKNIFKCFIYFIIILLLQIINLITILNKGNQFYLLKILLDTVINKQFMYINHAFNLKIKSMINTILNIIIQVVILLKYLLKVAINYFYLIVFNNKYLIFYKLNFFIKKFLIILNIIKNFLIKKLSLFLLIITYYNTTHSLTIKRLSIKWNFFPLIKLNFSTFYYYLIKYYITIHLKIVWHLFDINKIKIKRSNFVTKKLIIALNLIKQELVKNLLKNLIKFNFVVTTKLNLIKFFNKHIFNLVKLFLAFTTLIFYLNLNFILLWITFLIYGIIKFFVSDFFFLIIKTIIWCSYMIIQIFDSCWYWVTYAAVSLDLLPSHNIVYAWYYDNPVNYMWLLQLANNHFIQFTSFFLDSFGYLLDLFVSSLYLIFVLGVLNYYNYFFYSTSDLYIFLNISSYLLNLFTNECGIMWNFAIKNDDFFLFYTFFDFFDDAALNFLIIKSYTSLFFEKLSFIVNFFSGCYHQSVSWTYLINFFTSSTLQLIIFALKSSISLYVYININGNVLIIEQTSHLVNALVLFLSTSALALISTIKFFISFFFNAWNLPVILNLAWLYLCFIFFKFCNIFVFSLHILLNFMYSLVYVLLENFYLYRFLIFDFLFFETYGLDFDVIGDLTQILWEFIVFIFICKFVVFNYITIFLENNILLLFVEYFFFLFGILIYYVVSTPIFYFIWIINKFVLLLLTTPAYMIIWLLKKIIYVFICVLNIFINNFGFSVISNLNIFASCIMELLNFFFIFFDLIILDLFYFLVYFLNSILTYLNFNHMLSFTLTFNGYFWVSGLYYYLILLLVYTLSRFLILLNDFDGRPYKIKLFYRTSEINRILLNIEPISCLVDNNSFVFFKFDYLLNAFYSKKHLTDNSKRVAVLHQDFFFF